MKREYYYITHPNVHYFKYTRPLEHFKYDNIFINATLTTTQLIKFLLKIRNRRILTNVLCYGYDFKDFLQLFRINKYLYPFIKLYCFIFSDWWCRPELIHESPYNYYYNLTAFLYSNIKYIVCTDYRTLGYFLNRNLENYKRNIISWDSHNCYNKCFIPFNNNPINKILVSGDVQLKHYPERTKMLQFYTHVKLKQRSHDVWSNEKSYSEYLNKYLCCFSSSVYPYNMVTGKGEYSGLILLKTYEILGSGALLLSPLIEKNNLLRIGLIEDVHCMFVDMSDDSKIKEKLDFILDIKNRPLIDTIRRNGQVYGKLHLNSISKYELLKYLIINN